MTKQNHAGTLEESGYAPVNGLQMYYEIHGSGRPLVLLHGNLSTINTSFGKVLPALASTRRIIAVEQQGHGHTADRDHPFSLAQWAQDTTTLLRHLGIEQADFFGYSSGGAVALEIAVRVPDLVRPEHTVEMFRLLGGGVVGDIFGLPRSQLAVLPGTTHVTLVDRAEWLISMITEFLDAPMGDSRHETRMGEES
jgi:hypothetical protein